MDITLALLTAALLGASQAIVLKLIFGEKAALIPFGSLVAVAGLSDFAPWWALLGCAVTGQALAETYMRWYKKSGRQHPADFTR